MTPLLKVEGLDVRYGAIHAVKNVDLEVGVGEIVTLVGPNGAGKSSILAAIAGDVESSARAMEFDGRSLAGVKPEKRVRLKLGLVPEGRHVFSGLTVAENLRLGATTVKDAEQAAASISHVRELFPVLERLNGTLAGKLSGGEQQQLAIARALISKPRLLLLDEPSLGLAPLVIDQLFETIQTLREDGTSILLVEQHAARAIAMADQSFVLSRGEIALRAPRGVEIDPDELADAYLGRTGGDG